MAYTADGPESRGARPRASRFLLLFVLTALVASTCGGPTPSPRPSTTAATPSGATAPSDNPTAAPSATDAAVGPTPAPTPIPTPATTGWAKVTLAKYAPVASLTATKRGAAGAALDTAFRLTSLDGTSPAALASRLEVTPKIKLRPGAARDDTIVLRPATPLQAGMPYRFTIRRPDGTVAQAWTLTIAKPLGIVGTLPSEGSTGVPRDTGIEFTFDQPGVTAASVRDAFSIRPKVSGRFEVHGDTVVFVPSKRLKALTTYTVTLKKGIPLPGTGQKLATGRTFRFETKATGSVPDQLVFNRPLIDTATADAPAMIVDFADASGDDRARVPSKLAIRIYRLPDVEAATAAYTRLQAVPEWARAGHAPVDVGGLPVVFKAKVSVMKGSEGGDYRNWLVLPAPLKAGWYILATTYDGRPYQVMIQSSNLAAYTMVTDTRTVVWVNSLASGKPVKDAEVSLAGASLGRTDSEGLQVADTPASATRASTDGRPIYLTVRDRNGRGLFVPITPAGMCSKCEWGDVAAEQALDAWWHVLATDRSVYRTTDRVDAWGVVRSRDGGALAKRIDVSLEPRGDEGRGPAVVTAPATTTTSGMFHVSLPFTDVPTGDYAVVLTADGVDLGETWAQVGSIVKPAYRVEMTTDKRAVVAGTTMTAAVEARFFEGTPVAGVEFAFGGDDFEAGPSTTARTNADGVATTHVALAFPDYEGDQWGWQRIDANPTLPEEAQISGGTSVAVFRATALIDAAAVLKGKRLAVNGSVHDVDFARMETADPNDWEIDPSGAPRAGATVELTYTELVPTQRRTGTAYDFIEKRTMPVYEYGEREVPLGTRTVTTGKGGTFEIARDVTGGTRSYRIEARYVDAGGRAVTTTAYASVGANPEDEDFLSYLRSDDGSTSDDEHLYSVGERVRVTFHTDRPHQPSDRYLFTITHRGFQRAVVQAGATFTTSFRESWIPNAAIEGVRFTGAGYDVIDGAYGLDFRLSDRELRVTLTPDAARYEPGDTVRLAVRTADPAGHPVAATAAVRVIDEKLYDLGYAEDVDLLGSLYTGVSSGVVATAWSHRLPDEGDGGGDTTGGGGDERSDFRDTLFFDEVTTSASGEATVVFKVSDDLTSWRASAAAIDDRYRAGNTILDIPVGLPFFAEAALAPEYLAGDRATLRVRGYGSALRSGDRVSFEISAPSLGMAPTTVSAPAFAAASVTLPAFTAGRHEIKIVATSGSGTSRLRDALVKTVRVVTHRAIQGRTVSAPLTAGFDLPGGTTGFTTVALSDGGRGRVIPVLLSNVAASTGRADDLLAAAIAQDVLTGTFAMPMDALAPDEPNLAAFQAPDGGIALVPYASPDVTTSSFAAMADDPHIDATKLAEYLGAVADRAAPTTLRHIVALAGLAALDRPVMSEIRGLAADTKLSPTKRAWLALGAFMGGDELLAASLEQSILAKSGQRLGPWVRVSAGGLEATSTTTAVLAIVASGIGDPVAADMDAYVDTYPPKDTLVDLPRTLAARLWAERTPGASATMTATVDGVTRRIEVAPDRPTWLTLTPAQVATTMLVPVTGSVIVTTRWEAPLDAASLHRDGVTEFSRVVTPAGAIPIDGALAVTYTVTLTKQADDGCWLVTDFVPSGLAPVTGTVGWYSDDDDEDTAVGGPGIEQPWRIDGQRVDFCVTVDPKHPTHTLRYLARVVTPGTYAWEPAVIQSSIVREHGATIAATKVVVADQR